MIELIKQISLIGWIVIIILSIILERIVYYSLGKRTIGEFFNNEKFD